MKYANARIEIGYFDRRPVLRVRDAVVDVGARTILVEWHEGARWYRYEGVRSGQGHFLLRRDDARGKATLHRFQYSPVLEGYWSGSGTTGFWRIHLPQDPQAKVIALARARRPQGAHRARRERPIRAA